MPQFPARINGFNIVAVAPKLFFTRVSDKDAPNWYFSQKEYIIIGHDPSRAYEKYVVATIDATSDMKEWYWGHYTISEIKALEYFTSLSYGDMLKNFPTPAPQNAMDAIINDPAIRASLGN